MRDVVVTAIYAVVGIDVVVVLCWLWGRLECCIHQLSEKVTILLSSNTNLGVTLKSLL